MEKLLKEFCDFSNFNDHTIKKFIKYKTTSSNEKTITIFTDGSCKKNGQSTSSGGIGVFCPKTDKRVSMSFEDACANLLQGKDIGKCTNQKAELLAIYKALLLIDKTPLEEELTDFIIKTDSIYCVKVFTKWFLNWQRNGWISSSGNPVLNQDIIRPCVEIIKKRKNIFFEYVPAHQEEPTDPEKYNNWYGNAVADQLATASS